MQPLGSLEGLILPKTRICELCMKRKAKRSPFKNVGTNKQELKEIVFRDVCGLFKGQSIWGGRYFLLLIEATTR
jgi:hypothetical protein